MTVTVQQGKSDQSTDWGSMATDWWLELRERQGDRAQLRRADNLLAASLVPAVHILERAWRNQGLRGRRDYVLAAAVALAHVKGDTGGESFGEAMGKPMRERNRPPVSEMRFRRLIETAAPEDLILPIRRIIASLDGQAPVASLAAGILWWNEKTRRDWAFDYFAVAPDPTKQKQ